ncbi:hypothetical protein SmJEL517_g05127 [Synchytrium microbalum]|uniref:TRP C-terminal domain-containing protein n=1 Tax=Synchytrium microbalum TaxID=1806994 RepID=A0A507C0K1_9FUNG|nr:uncharacterized protein SmJEL517_g05127 [Synchytrium microbalum]TPX31594.1 hypothetical protein SmJEL517_g05127 [Synchytrium microbalum]
MRRLSAFIAIFSIIAWISPIAANEISNLPITFPIGTTSQILGNYGFYAGGSLNIVVNNITIVGDAAAINPNDPFATQPVNNTAGLTLYVCDASIFVASGRANLCTLLPTCGQYAFSIPTTINGLPPPPYSMNLTVPINAVFTTFFTWCHSSVLSFNVNASFKNPGLANELSSDDYPLLWTYLVAAGLWLIAIVIWSWNWIYYRQQKIMFHDLIVLIPATEFLAALAHYYVVLYFSFAGVIPDWMGVTRWILSGVAVFSRFVILFLASKGWCVLRTRLANVEWRTIYSVAGFLAGAEVFYRIVGAGAMICYVVFTVTAFFYLFWCVRVHLENLMYYMDATRVRTEDGRETTAIPLDRPPSELLPAATRAAQAAANDADETGNGGNTASAAGASNPSAANNREEGWFRRRRRRDPSLASSARTRAKPKVVALDGDWDLNEVYKSKFRMLKRARAMFSIYCAVTVVVLAVDILGLYPDYYVLITLQQAGYLGCFMALARIYRLQPTTQVIAIPAWLVTAVRKQMTNNTAVTFISDGIDDDAESTPLTDVTAIHDADEIFEMPELRHTVPL